MRIQILAEVIWWYMHVVFAKLKAEFVCVLGVTYECCKRRC